MALERAAQRGIDGIVRSHDQLGRFRIARHPIQVIGAKDVIDPAMLEHRGIYVDDVRSCLVELDERSQQSQMCRTARLLLGNDAAMRIPIDQRGRRAGELHEFHSHGIELSLMGRAP